MNGSKKVGPIRASLKAAKLTWTLQEKWRAQSRCFTSPPLENKKNKENKGKMGRNDIGGEEVIVTAQDA